MELISKKYTNKMKLIFKIYMNKIKLNNLIIFLSLIFCFFLIDWLTKYFLFDTRAANDISYEHNLHAKDFKVFGIKSIINKSTTLFSALSISMPLELRIFINFFLIFCFSIAGIWSQQRLTAIALGILVGGMYGNSLDVAFTTGKIANNFVRDIIYIPWANGGVFNLADVFIIIGAILMFIEVIISLFRKPNKKENDKKLEKPKSVIAKILKN